jgi:putative endonuclease
MSGGTPVRSGEVAERRAEAFLADRGLRLVERNYRCRSGEIDLVMEERGVMVFVEVRYRRSSAFGSAAETVTPAKQRRIVSAAQHFLLRRRPYRERPCRFDVLAVSGEGERSIDWLRNAFEPAA